MDAQRHKELFNQGIENSRGISALGEAVQKLTEEVHTLALNVNTQTITLRGFREIYDLQINALTQIVNNLTTRVDTLETNLSRAGGWADVIRVIWAVVGAGLLPIIFFVLRSYFLNSG